MGCGEIIGDKPSEFGQVSRLATVEIVPLRRRCLHFYSQL